VQREQPSASRTAPQAESEQTEQPAAKKPSTKSTVRKTTARKTTTKKTTTKKTAEVPAARPAPAPKAAPRPAAPAAPTPARSRYELDQQYRAGKINSSQYSFQAEVLRRQMRAELEGVHNLYRSRQISWREKRARLRLIRARYGF
jgi:hypothetical protein